MEFPFDISAILPAEISIVDCHLKARDVSQIASHAQVNGTIPEYPSPRPPCRYVSKTSKEPGQSVSTNHLMMIIDSLGEASAKAQGLHSPITTGSRLQKSNQRLYIIKDPKCNGSLGSVIGMLKVGKKRLFVLDERGAHNELDPLCVLDFYVHESRQRQGYGHLLFEKMLQVEDILPHHLAVDRPSEKFLAFLQKYYGLKDTITQANNFVVFCGFFDGRQSEVKHAEKGKKSEEETTREMNALKEIPVPLNSLQTRGRRLSTGAGRCLQWTDEFYDKDKARLYHSSQSSSPVLVRNSERKRSDGATYGRMRVAASDGELEMWSVKRNAEQNKSSSVCHGAMSSPSSCGPDLSGTSPVAGNMKNDYSPTKWQHLQSSSWKVLGIPPPDYSHKSPTHDCHSNKEVSFSNRFW